MHINEITYTLPPERIAKYPPKVRGEARLLVLHKDSGEIEHKRYTDLPEYIQSDDLIVRNDTKVIPARLITKNPRGGTVELLLIESHQPTLQPSKTLECLYGGSVQESDQLGLEELILTVKKITEHGTVVINSPIPSTTLIEKYGHTPIPPYLKREDQPEDKKRYQTQFAVMPGSVAAPTASLNFTEELEQRLRDKGVHIAELTLHVGRGTFLPVKTKNIEDHFMHKEFYTIPPETLRQFELPLKNQRKVVALGTTVTRALEHASSVILDPLRQRESEASSDPESRPQSISNEADIFIYPGYKFKIVDALLTNFHAPKSTALLLAAAFAGQENLLHAYEEALKTGYKFLSYGDSMLII